MHDRVAAKKRRTMVTSPHWWDDKMLVTGKYEEDEFVARVMDHIADQYDGPVGSDPPRTLQIVGGLAQQRSS